MKRTVEDEQRIWARVAGYALLEIIVIGIAGILLQSVAGAGSDTRNTLAHEPRYRLGLACEFAMLNGDILLAVALYALLRHWNAPLALLGALWRVANALVLAVGVVAALTALDLLAAPDAPPAFRPDQSDALAAHFLRLHSIASLIGLLLWSMGAAVHSVLLWDTRYIPRILSGAYGAVVAVIFVGCVAIVVAPAIEPAIDPWFVLPDLPVELAVALWLVIRGARIEPSAQPNAPAS